MKVAFSFHEDRIAPVFDTAERILVAEVEASAIRSETVAKLTAEQPLDRAEALAGMGVKTLVCGAVSVELQRFLTARGLQVVPFVAGNLRDIVQAWLEGRMGPSDYRMPGCRRRDPSDPTGHAMNRMGRRGRTMEAGSGGKGAGKGRSQDCAAAGPSSERGPGRRRGGGCLCPACGHREPHVPGIPCHRKMCPACGEVMTREFPPV